ncbi:MAG: 3-deoxy-manno-octulosonate cytidylyltransferase [Candidatus Melainabacteria bacterium GWA2_34_9]|nr:MAG: 3-deoxy-manno-octulosonate cytidylyltransferase [Candidatus Melainabacteria bacterium GWA2_34_9]
MAKVAIIIPARYASTRLPGKPLIKIHDKTIIQWVYERACQSKLAQEVIVATDDERIYQSVKEFGGQVNMTASSHQSGSDRIAEIAKENQEMEIIVNVQGDEPLITPESIDGAINALISDNNADISTLIREITDKDEILNHNIVKVVTDNSGKALYFSRAVIPYERESRQTKFYAHIGLYAYRRESLLKMTQLEQTNLEKAECLEQLRALQSGMSIKTVVVDYKPIGIDTPEDVEEFKRYLQSKLY